ncbi:MAG: hypothetical protein AAFZ18_09465 [Myxococcota bacterium]
MQRFFSLFVILAILAGGGWYLYNQKAEQEAKAKIEASLRDARRGFSERARASVSEDGTEAYLEGVKKALDAYGEELTSVVYAERPNWLDVAAKKKLADEMLEAGEISEAQHKGQLENYTFVRDAYDTLMNGVWKTDLTQPGNGETRMDIYGLKRIRDPDGNPLLEARFFLWGVEPNSRLSFGNVTLEYWREDAPDAKVRRQRRKEGRDPDAPVLKPLGRAEGDATPVIFVQNPAKTIETFPSYVAIGALWFPQVPKEAKVMDLRYSYALRKGGSEVQTQLVWDKMAIPTKWRLGEGEEWMADEVEASEEELAGVDPSAPKDAGVEASE